MLPPFDACSATVAGQSSGQSRRARPPRKSPTGQALELQSVALRDGIADSTPVHVKAALMRAWVDLQEIVMALRGQGKPKPVEARNATHKRKQRDNAAPIAANATANATAKYNGSQAHEQRAESVCEPSHTVVNGTLDKSA